MIKKLKVGLFIDTFFPMVDGVINVVDNYAKKLSKNCDVTVFCPEGRKPFDDSTLPYKVVRCTKKFKLSFLDYDLPLPKRDKEFIRAVENSHLDIVHIHSPFSIGKMGIKYAKKHNIPVVATLHSQFKKDFKRAVKLNGLTYLMVKTIMRAFNKCDECWAVNSEIAKIFKGYGAKVLPKVRNNGTDLVFFENEQQIEELRNKYQVKDEETVFLFIGRIVYLKNIFFIEKVLKILKDKGFKFKMFFVGTGTDEEKLKKQIKADGIEENVIFTGKIVDRVEISKYYNMADLFVFPSTYDASSLVQIEAASQKTPTIFLRGAATAATVTENVNGYVGDKPAEKFADKIVEIFKDKDKYKQICENAYKDLYVSWDETIDRSYNRYLELIEEKKKQKVSKK